jgi:signal peptidase I
VSDGSDGSPSTEPAGSRIGTPGPSSDVASTTTFDPIASDGLAPATRSGNGVGAPAPWGHEGSAVDDRSSQPVDPSTGGASGDDGDDGAVYDGAPADGGRSSARVFVDWVVVIVVALLVAFVVRGFVLAHFVVDGSSMSPTLESGDRVFVNKLSYRLHDPNRGDVVVLHQISGASERDLIKRVIGLPGEEIEMRSCQVFIDGAALTEPYLDAATTNGNCGGDFESVLIPDGNVFVMGDNRGGSQDSRAIGPIDHNDLVGRAFVVFWPSGSWQWL